jgi:hypothetical protein
MAITVAITGVGPQSGASYLASGGPADETLNELIVDCLLTLSGSYTVGGDPLSFSNASGLALGLPGGAPAFVSIMELVPIGTAASGFTFLYVPGPTLAAPTQNGGGIQIFGAGAASGQGGTQLTASTYASQTPSLNGTVLKARFWFVKGS